MSLLGKYAEPGDESVLSALLDLWDAVQEEDLSKWSGRAVEGGYGCDNFDIESAVLFAQANMGAPGMVEQFRDDLLSGTTEIRKRRVRYLKMCHGTKIFVEMALACLDDDEEVTYCGASGDNRRDENYKRIRDFAVEAFGEWYDDFPVRTLKCDVYADADIELTRQFGLEKLAEIEE